MILKANIKRILSGYSGFLALYIFMGCATVDDHWDNARSSERALDYEKAITQYTKAIKASKDDWELAESYRYRGNLYYKIGSYENAVSDYSELVIIGKRQSYMKKGLGYIERGNSYAAMEEYGPAIDDFSEYIELNERDPVGYSSRGDIYYITNDTELSQKDYDKAMELYNAAAQTDPVMKVDAFVTWKSIVQKYKKYFNVLPDMSNQAKIIITPKPPGNITVTHVDDNYSMWSDCVATISQGRHKVAIRYDWDYRVEKRDYQGLNWQSTNELDEFNKKHGMSPVSPPEERPVGNLHITTGSRTFTSTITQNFDSGNIYEIVYSSFNNYGHPNGLSIKNVTDILED
jgi:tetratricopeptide (TPR) repeat protein